MKKIWQQLGGHLSRPPRLETGTRNVKLRQSKKKKYPLDRQDMKLQSK